ncbi:hypothetical protein [Spirosoma luteolum]
MDTLYKTLLRKRIYSDAAFAGTYRIDNIRVLQQKPFEIALDLVPRYRETDRLTMEVLSAHPQRDELQPIHSFSINNGRTWWGISVACSGASILAFLETGNPDLINDCKPVLDQNDKELLRLILSGSPYL